MRRPAAPGGTVRLGVQAVRKSVGARPTCTVGHPGLAGGRLRDSTSWSIGALTGSSNGLADGARALFFQWMREDYGSRQLITAATEMSSDMARATAGAPRAAYIRGLRGDPRHHGPQSGAGRVRRASSAHAARFARHALSARRDDTCVVAGTIVVLVHRAARRRGLATGALAIVDAPDGNVPEHAGSRTCPPPCGRGGFVHRRPRGRAPSAQSRTSTACAAHAWQRTPGRKRAARSSASDTIRCPMRVETVQGVESASDSHHASSTSTSASRRGARFAGDWPRALRRRGRDGRAGYSRRTPTARRSAGATGDRRSRDVRRRSVRFMRESSERTGVRIVACHRLAVSSTIYDVYLPHAFRESRDATRSARRVLV
jgi:hypothetical protein